MRGCLKWTNLVRAMILASAVPFLSLPAQADPSVADPGFSYVDMNNDGLYNAADGDINVEPLILNDGRFDTQKSEGYYHAPRYPVSLVIPRSRSLVQSSFDLHSDANITIHGTLTATSIEMEACINVDLTLAQLNFITDAEIWSDTDVILDGVTITGDAIGPSDLTIYAHHNITGAPVQDNTDTFVPAIAVGTKANLKAGSNITLDEAAIITIQPTSTLSIFGKYAVKVSNFSSLAAVNGDVQVTSQWGKLNLDTSVLQADTVEIKAFESASFASATIQTTGDTNVTAGGKVVGNSASVISGNFYLTSNTTVSLNDSAIFSLGDLEVVGRSHIYASGSTPPPASPLAWTAGTHILVKSIRGNVYARSGEMTILTPLGPIAFYAGGGLIDVTGSVFAGTVTYGPPGVHVVGP